MDKRRAEQELKHKKDQKSGKRSVVEDSGKKKEEKDSERASGLGKVNSKIMDLEMMLADHKRRLDKLRTEEAQKRSFEPFRRTLDDALFDQNQQATRDDSLTTQKSPLLDVMLPVFSFCLIHRPIEVGTQMP